MPYVEKLVQFDKLSVRVDYWRYYDGWQDIIHILRVPGGPTREFDGGIVGWHCWAYTNNNELFNEWMKRSMVGEYESIFRFNSGDPMYTVHIISDIDASLFKLTWA